MRFLNFPIARATRTISAVMPAWSVHGLKLDEPSLILATHGPLKPQGNFAFEIAFSPLERPL